MNSIRLNNYNMFVADNSEEKILVFTIDDCTPCAELKQVLQDLEGSSGFMPKIYLIEIADNEMQALKNEAGVTHYPMLQFYINNHLAGTRKGYVKLDNNPAQKLHEWLLKKKTALLQASM